MWVWRRFIAFNALLQARERKKKFKLRGNFEFEILGFQIPSLPCSESELQMFSETAIATPERGAKRKEREKFSGPFAQESTSRRDV